MFRETIVEANGAVLVSFLAVPECLKQDFYV